MTQPNSKQTENKLRKISFYAVTGILALFLTMSAYMKIINAEEMVNGFSKWGLLELKNIIAVAEIIGVLLLFIPNFSAYGTYLLSIIMAGAVYIHLKYDEPFFFPLSILIVLWLNLILIKPKKTRP